MATHPRASSLDPPLELKTEVLEILESWDRRFDSAESIADEILSVLDRPARAEIKSSKSVHIEDGIRICADANHFGFGIIYVSRDETG